MNKPKIYLAGKMAGLTFEEMNTWRQQITNMLQYNTDKPLHIENPCDYYNFERDRSTYTDKEVKEFDLWLVKNCDLVIVNLDFPDSIGTAIELHMASEWKIPVIGFGKTEVHPWMELCLTKRCKTMLDAVEYVIDFYLPNL
jgi:nucleoside 2-deoxyribosyltransferase